MPKPFPDIPLGSLPTGWMKDVFGWFNPISLNFSIPKSDLKVESNTEEVRNPNQGNHNSWVPHWILFGLLKVRQRSKNTDTHEFISQRFSRIRSYPDILLSLHVVNIRDELFPGCGVCTTWSPHLYKDWLLDSSWWIHSCHLLNLQDSLYCNLVHAQKQSLEAKLEVTYGSIRSIHSGMQLISWACLSLNVTVGFG